MKYDCENNLVKHGSHINNVFWTKITLITQTGTLSRWEKNKKKLLVKEVVLYFIGRQCVKSSLSWLSLALLFSLNASGRNHNT